ncbi:hypothetical protein Egran_04974 [Elaphomyces granulatus]|uniref:Myb/SANT-like domain-containing protein n=1 Tax=Elaphomyces granulatus TaxID=519963 RepID=A0A232LSV1_9EURO|nr:hypothetical protein Egran_04974 [Elaphomyces granulatus]
MAPNGGRPTRSGNRPDRVIDSLEQEMLEEVVALDAEEARQHPKKRQKKTSSIRKPLANPDSTEGRFPKALEEGWESPVRDTAIRPSPEASAPQSPLQQRVVNFQTPSGTLSSSITNATGGGYIQSPANPNPIDSETMTNSPAIQPSDFPLQSTLNSNQSMTPAPPAKLRVRWTDIMEQVLLAALRVIVLRGKSSFDCFKRAHWVEAAGKVKEVYEGPADLDWKRAKSKFEDKYRPLWRKWKDHCASLSGWTENEEGLPQNSKEVMDYYFAAFPEYKEFRHSLPVGYKYLVEILGDRGEFAAVEETSEEEIIISSGEEIREEEEARQSMEQPISRSICMNRSVRSPTQSTSRSGSVSSSRSISVAANTGQKRTKEKNSSAAQNLRSQLVAKAARRKKDREKKSDKLLRRVNEFGSASAKLAAEVVAGYESASKGPIEKAIELFDSKYANGYSEDDVFKVYDFLQREEKAAAFSVMAEVRQAGWLRYELRKLENNGN